MAMNFDGGYVLVNGEYIFGDGDGYFFKSPENRAVYKKGEIGRAWSIEQHQYDTSQRKSRRQFVRNQLCKLLP